jgi:hypothetical protein
MRKKIPCKVVESVPLAICSPIVCQDMEFISSLDDVQVKKVTSTLGDVIYTSRLNITNISDIESSFFSVFDAYF